MDDGEFTFTDFMYRKTSDVGNLFLSNDSITFQMKEVLSRNVALNSLSISRSPLFLFV